ncbi:hypothetical protein ACK3C2_00535 [Mycoplasmoides gallisepticum]|uniref:hypothetical protein n=1 Tax=Mycoplasmoides gallisepticum TaxID=2096 RepID=UPI00335F14FF
MRWEKKKLLVLSLVTMPLMGTLTSCFNPNNEKGKDSQQIKKYDPELALQTNIVKAQDDADIDVYFSSWGVQPFYNLIKISYAI